MTQGSPPLRCAAITTLMLGLVLGLAGCDDATDAAPAKRLSMSSNIDTIDYGSFGTTSAVDCADGKSLNVAGSNNRLTVRGRCEAVNVAGADNRITVERVDKSLTLTGLNNSVTYRAGEPSVDDRGSGNTIAGSR